MEIEKWKVIWELFHQLWGHCKESPEYEKPVWKDLQGKLQDIQKEGTIDARKRIRRRDDRQNRDSK